MQNIRQLIWAFRYKKAVRKADRLASAFGLRYFVIVFGGRLRVIPKQTLKDLVRKGRFRSGTTIQDIERKALYITKTGGCGNVYGR